MTEPMGTPLLAEEEPLWMAARSLADVAGLTVRWLTGDIRSQPFYFGPVDVDDAAGLTAALVACNRAGLLTNCSQAGSVDAGDGWTLLAAVTGFMDTAAAHRLAEMVIADGRFQVQYEGQHGRLPRIPVTVRGGEPCLWFGGDGAGELVEELYGQLDEDVMADIYWSDQVTVWDPVAGRNELWGFLSTVMGQFGGEDGTR